MQVIATYTANLAVFLQQEALKMDVTSVMDFTRDPSLKVCNGFSGGGFGANTRDVLDFYFEREASAAGGLGHA